MDNDMDPELLGLLPYVPDDLFLDDADTEQEPFKLDAQMAEFLLPQRGDITKARAVAGKRDADGVPVGGGTPTPYWTPVSMKWNSLMEPLIHSL
jgi:hypothetical protein